jgi:hypothetical protein
MVVKVWLHDGGIARSPNMGCLKWKESNNMIICNIASLKDYLTFALIDLHNS